MPNEPTREEKLCDAFLVVGSQYYALARYCAEVQYLPVAVTLFHHAIEMLLKGSVSKTDPTADPKREFGHDLVKLWQSFKRHFHTLQFSRFDTTIVNLNRVEELRYPEAIVDNGFALNIRFGTKVPLVLPGTEQLPQYAVDVSDLDEIAAGVFEALGVSAAAYFRNVPSELKRPLPPAFTRTDG